MSSSLTVTDKVPTSLIAVGAITSPEAVFVIKVGRAKPSEVLKAVQVTGSALASDLEGIV